MPYYEVNHTTPLLPSQKSDLALRLTQIHSTRFATPRLFVNVRFTDLTASSPTDATTLYVGGHQRSKSHILAHVRTGASRTSADFDALCAEIAGAWEEIVEPMPKVRRGEEGGDRGLYSVFVLGDIVAGREAGFAIPGAGGDGEWLVENMGAFRARAEGGEVEFGELVREVEERGLIVGKKSEAQRLEEMMGWGDSA